MNPFSLFFAFIATGLVFAAPLNLTGTVKALSESGEPIENAIVLLKVINENNSGLTAYARTLSDKDGNWTLLPNKEAPGDIAPIAKPTSPAPLKFTSYSVLDLKGKTHAFGNLPQGVYVLLGKTEGGKTYSLGTIYHNGGVIQNKITTSYERQKADLQATAAKSLTSAGDEIQLIVRKTGYLPKEIEIGSFNESVGVVVLERDPLENRIDSVLALMSLDDKIYQMNQPLVGSYGEDGHLFGSVLHGGDGYSSSVLPNGVTEMNKPAYAVKIPVTYGKDMMHGAAAISGATIFPHNIGLGATRDSALVRKTCEVTAQESWAGNVDLIFGPAIPVPQDERWGRVYEGFGETAELAVAMGAACVRGYQGEKYNAPWRVIATAKHFMGDGGTTNGVDRGNTVGSDSLLRALFLPGYEATVEQGVLSIMASFNQINGTHQHIDSLRLTGWLKTELGFDGYVIADWSGISNSITPGATDACGYGCTNATQKEAVRKSINAGLDMAMNEGSFTSTLKTLVNENAVSQNRIDDAVRRILRAKFRAGRMDDPNGTIAKAAATVNGGIGSEAHKLIAREAVQKSLVLLKNDNALPISKTAKVFLTGSHASSPCNQCGGWTLGWSECTEGTPKVTTIQQGIDEVSPGAKVATADAADVIIYATGETPYAEWNGDITNITFTDTQLATLKNNNPTKKIITIFISGRARETEAMIANSDAFVAAWLPGSEGAGIADVLFGDVNFTGKLPTTWPKDKSIIPFNSPASVTEPTDTYYPYGFGLKY
ncbi:hypothetical protein AGMMS49938_03570 [Fibrobacterales bacterium]|nr:hypothetical protein AGMMS49938_03570 [Fibrobacterales bacterium]